MPPSLGGKVPASASAGDAQMPEAAGGADRGQSSEAPGGGSPAKKAPRGDEKEKNIDDNKKLEFKMEVGHNTAMCLFIRSIAAKRDRKQVLELSTRQAGPTLSPRRVIETLMKEDADILENLEAPVKDLTPEVVERVRAFSKARVAEIVMEYQNVE